MNLKKERLVRGYKERCNMKRNYAVKYGETIYCDVCGFPLYLGDIVIMIGDEYQYSDRYYCSNACCKQGEEREVSGNV